MECAKEAPDFYMIERFGKTGNLLVLRSREGGGGSTAITPLGHRAWGLR